MKYPKIGEQVRIKGETGLHEVIEVIPGEYFGPHIRLDNGRYLPLSYAITKHQKWITVYVIQQYYHGGHRWEDVTQEEVRSEAIQRRKEYRENTEYPTRLIRRKELNPLYQP